MRSIRLRWRVLALLAVFALVVAACSSDDSDDTTTTEAAQEETTTTAGEATTTTAGETTETTEAAQPADGQLAGLTVVDENTFTVELTEANADFPISTYYAAYFPLPDVAFEDPVAFEESPIGNGPFMMDGVWEHDVRIPTKAYPDYPGDDGAKIDKLEFTIIQDEATAYNEALAGGIDVLDVVPTDNLPTYQADFPDSSAEFSVTSFNYLGFPAYLPQFTKEHRQALSMAVDREAITEAIFLGGRDPAASTIPPSLGGRDFVCDSWTYNPEMAKELWDAAGDPGEIIVWFNTGGGHEAWVEAVSNFWGENLGIDTSAIKFETLEFSEYLPVIDAQEITGPFRLGWGMDYPSPLNFLEPLYASYNAAPVGSNNTIYNNPDFDQALADGKAKVAASGNLADGLPDYFAAEDILCDDAQVMPMFFGKAQTVWNADTASNVFVDANTDLGYSNIESTTGEIKTRIVEPEHLFPTTSNESEGIAVLRALFRGLTNLEASTNEMYNAHAESITSDDGGKTWTIVLKPGWTFHDGTPVTAESYVKAWSYGADPANAQQNNSFYSGIVGYDELNPEG